MTIPVTLNLPEDAYRRAERFARLANCDVRTVLANALTRSLPSISDAIDKLPLISELDDAQIIALTQLEMAPDQDDRLSELLYKQQAATLTPQEPEELDDLMQIYREGLLRKATALAEAVHRGLINPLES
jgi:hypothetical protein